MPRLTNATPKYRKHQASGQAIVTLNGKDHYLGPHNTKASKAEYDRLIGEWLANDRRPPTAASGGKDNTVIELLAAFWSHAKAYYVDTDGQPNTEAKNYRTLIKRLKAYCGSIPVSELRPPGLADAT